MRLRLVLSLTLKYSSEKSKYILLIESTVDSDGRNPIAVLIAFEVTRASNVALSNTGVLLANLQRPDLRLLREPESGEKEKRVIKIIGSINY